MSEVKELWDEQALQIINHETAHILNVEGKLVYGIAYEDGVFIDGEPPVDESKIACAYFVKDEQKSGDVSQLKMVYCSVVFANGERYEADFGREGYLIKRDYGWRVTLPEPTL